MSAGGVVSRDLWSSDSWGSISRVVNRVSMSRVVSRVPAGRVSMTRAVNRVSMLRWVGCSRIVW